MTRQNLRHYKCCNESFASMIKMCSLQFKQAAAAFITLIFTNDYNDHIMLVLPTLGNDPGFVF